MMVDYSEEGKTYDDMLDDLTLSAGVWLPQTYSNATPWAPIWSDFFVDNSQILRIGPGSYPEPTMHSPLPTRTCISGHDLRP